MRSLKKKDDRGQLMLWSGVGLIVLNVVLICCLNALERTGTLFYVAAIVFCIIDCIAVYLVARKFFGKK